MYGSKQWRHTSDMKKPHLEILSESNDATLRGRCSACPNVTFSLPRTTESSLSLIHSMFSEHLRKVHNHKQAIQEQY
jgi:Fe-S cluster biogenesis protein NfuA